FLRQTPVEQVVPVAQPGVQSVVAVVHASGSVGAAPATHVWPPLHRPAHVPGALAIVVIVQSFSVGSVADARASLSSVARWPMPSSTPMPRYAIAGCMLPSIASDANWPTSSPWPA